MVRRRALEAVGGFDTAFSVLADWELYLRLADHGRFALHPEVLTGYVIHTGGMHVQQAPAALAEFDHLIARYGRSDHPGGDGMYDKYFLRWAASAHRRAGRRFSAARLYLRNARRHGDLRDVLRALVAVTSESLMVEIGRRRGLPAPEPPAWLALYGAPGVLRPARVPVADDTV
jgi:GT2 family glycosyltransferase